MREIDRAEVLAAWRRLSQRYGWSLAGDELVLIEHALAECQALDPAGSPRDCAQIGVWRAYGALMCERLRQRDERAAQELWLMFVRMALRRGRTRADAEELAQEAVVRVLFKLPTLRSPQGMLSWAIRIICTVLREQAAAATGEPLPDDDAQHGQPLADAHDFALAAEQRLLVGELIARLRALLPNQIELATIVRGMIFGEKPREIARELQLPPYRIRVAKSRALERLRNDAALLAWLRELAGDAALALESPGADTDDT